MKTATRTIGNNDAARIKAAIMDARIRFAAQHDAETVTLIFAGKDARAVADVIAAELAR